MREIDTARIAPELEARLAGVEAAAASDRGLTRSDWLALLTTAVTLPAFLLWLGWSG